MECTDKFFKSRKKDNKLLLIVAIIALLALIFIILCGYKGIQVTKELISYNELTVNEMFKSEKNMFMVIILAFFGFTFFIFYSYWVIRKFIKLIEEL